MLYIVISNSITKISGYNSNTAAFGYCTNLLYVYIPKSVTSIESNAFEYYQSIK